MALINNSFAPILTIGDGKIVKRVKSPTPKSIERTTKEGKVVYEEKYDSIEGNILDIKTHEGNYGKTWRVSINDGQQDYILELNYSGGYAVAFLKILPNIDLSRPVQITPRLTIENDKKKATVFVNQGEGALKHYYTKDNPNGLPDLKQMKVKGKITWDDSERMEFFENYINNEFRANLLGDITPF
jgi:hypothetical protein